jgi:hypothetical protein
MDREKEREGERERDCGCAKFFLCGEPGSTILSMGELKFAHGQTLAYRTSLGPSFQF